MKIGVREDKALSWYLCTLYMHIQHSVFSALPNDCLCLHMQRRLHAVAGHAAVLANGAMVVVGGVEFGGRLSPRVLRYSLEDDSWEVLRTGAFGPPGTCSSYVCIILTV